MTKEEFGEGLFSVLNVIGGILQLRDYRAGIAALRAKPGQLKQWQEREGKLLAQLQKDLVALPIDQAGEVARRYPWVARC